MRSSDRDLAVLRVERIVLNAIRDAELCASMKDYEGANKLLVAAAVEHERFFGVSCGGDPK